MAPCSVGESYGKYFDTTTTFINLFLYFCVGSALCNFNSTYVNEALCPNVCGLTYVLTLCQCLYVYARVRLAMYNTRSQDTSTESIINSVYVKYATLKVSDSRPNLSH